MLKSIPESNKNQCKICARKSDAEMMRIMLKMDPKGNQQFKKESKMASPKNDEKTCKRQPQRHQPKDVLNNIKTN